MPIRKLNNDNLGLIKMLPDLLYLGSQDVLSPESWRLYLFQTAELMSLANDPLVLNQLFHS